MQPDAPNAAARPSPPPRRRRRARRIPFLAQTSPIECGAACLAMVLAHHGHHVRVADVAGTTGIGRDGASARGLVDAARVYGLRGRGVQLDVDELHLLDPGTILHWDFNHFVVFERVTRDGIDIVDPGCGRRSVKMAEVRRSFTGVAVLLEPADGFSARDPLPRMLWRHLGQLLRQSGSWGRILVASLLLQLFVLAAPLATSLIVDRVIPAGDAHLLATVIAGIVTLVVLHFVTTMVRAHLLLVLRTRFDSRMTLGLLEHLLGLTYEFFRMRSAGDLLMRINSTATIREILTAGTTSTLLDGFFVIGYLLLLLLLAPGMALLTLLLAALQVGVFAATWSRQRQLMSDTLRTQAAADSNLIEILSGIETLKAMGAELRAAERWSGLFSDQLNVVLRRGRLGALVDALAGALRVAAPLVLLAAGAVQVLHGHLSLGTMLSVVALAQALLLPIGNLVGTASQLVVMTSYLDRLEDVLLAPREQEGVAVVPPPRSLSGRITLEEVSFRYSAAGRDVVHEASLSIAPGQFVAIVGRSGSGKSTLAHLLLGLYQPRRGRVLYDGLDLATLDARLLRRQLGIVPQQPFLFGATIRANIALSDPDMPLDAVIAAAKRACIHDEIAAMPLGYETPLLDGGASLSGGQRQRIALARALASRPKVLLLDEATSALDAATERAVQQQLTTVSCTRVVIAHRLSTVRDADLIVVLDDGHITESGTHDELLARGSVYAELVRAQLQRGRDAEHTRSDDGHAPAARALAGRSG